MPNTHMPYASFAAIDIDIISITDPSLTSAKVVRTERLYLTAVIIQVTATIRSW